MLVAQCLLSWFVSRVQWWCLVVWCSRVVVDYRRLLAINADV